MRTALLAALLCLTPAAAQAEDWVYVTTTKTGASFVDADSVSIDGDFRTFNMLVVPRVVVAGSVAESGPVTFDCKAMRRIVRAGFSHDAAGKVIRPSGAGDWGEIRPGTAFDLMADSICTDNPFKGRHFGAQMPIAEGVEMLKAKPE